MNGSGSTTAVNMTWVNPGSGSYDITPIGATGNSQLLSTFIQSPVGETQTVTISGLTGYTNGYTVYAYFNTNNVGYYEELGITGGSAVYGITSDNNTTLVLATGTGTANANQSDYAVWTGLSATTFTVSATELQGAHSAGLSGIEIVPNNITTAATSGGLNLLPFTTPLTLASGATLDLGGGTQTLASLSNWAGLGGIVQNSSTASTSILTLSPTGGGSATFSGLIAGGGTLGNLSLVMAGTGLQNLAGANTYTGGTQITGGTLQLGNANALGTGALAANGGVFDLAGLSVTLPSFSGARRRDR